MDWIHVRLDGPGGIPAEQQLKSLYISGMDFEPEERRLRILPDGTAELLKEKKPYMVHAKLNLPLYGNIWVMADNQGEGYTGDFVDFVTEAIRTYTFEAERLSVGIELSAAARGHLSAAYEYTHLASRGVDTPENRLYALAHAVYAAEAALLERSRLQLKKAARRDLKLGCNFFRYTSPNARYAKYFREIFDFATLPFYPRDTVPAEGVYDYGYIENALGFLEDNHITSKGHPLWFGHSEVSPDWLKKLSYEELKEQAGKIAAHHAGAFRGRIPVWDTMNEAHDWANCFELNQQQLAELTRICCEAQKEADPAAEAVMNVCLPFAEYVAGRYNCYGSLPEKLLSPLAYFRSLEEKNIAFDTIGIQMYFPARDMVAVSRLLDVYSGLGKPIHITEMGANGGVRSLSQGGPGSNWSQLNMSEGSWHGGWGERTQAEWMEYMYTILAARKEIKALTWWDFIEPSFFGNGAFLYENEVPREIFFRLKELKKDITGDSRKTPDWEAAYE